MALGRLIVGRLVAQEVEDQWHRYEAEDRRRGQPGLPPADGKAEFTSAGPVV